MPFFSPSFLSSSFFACELLPEPLLELLELLVLPLDPLLELLELLVLLLVPAEAVESGVLAAVVLAAGAFAAGVPVEFEALPNSPAEPPMVPLALVVATLTPFTAPVVTTTNGC